MNHSWVTRLLKWWNAGCRPCDTAWFLERDPHGGEPFTRWQANERLAEALCPLTSCLKADCVAAQLYRTDSQTACLAIINPSATEIQPDSCVYTSRSVGDCTNRRLLSSCCVPVVFCTELVFHVLLCEEDVWKFTLNAECDTLAIRLHKACVKLHETGSFIYAVHSNESSFLAICQSRQAFSKLLVV